MWTMLALAACTSPDTPDLGPRGDCNPVDDGHCLLPFPSTFFLADDAQADSGHRVSLGPTSLPVHTVGGQMRPDLHNERDGFPILGGAYTWLGPTSTDGLIRHDDLDAYRLPDAKTLWIDVETGERLPHWAELVEGPVQPDDRMLVLRPAVPMEHGRRYVIGIRDVRGTDGVALEPRPGFRTLRDGATTDDPDLVRQQAHYDADVFPVLDAAGVQRDDLQMAWDLVTVSEQGSTARMRHLRDEALAWAGPQGPPYRIDAVEDGDCSDPSVHAGRFVWGTMTVPLYLEQVEPGPDSLLTRGPDGLPTQVGETEVPFTMVLPCSVIDGSTAAPVAQYAHGLFSSEAFLEEDVFAELADRNGLVLFAQRWTGMSTAELPVITVGLTTSLNAFDMIPERLHQGQVEFLLGPRLLRGSLATDPVLTRADGSPMIDPAEITLYATSQGSILGGATLALSSDLERGLFVVPGMPFSLLLPRAALFGPFLQILDNTTEGPRDAGLMVPLMGMLWEPVESAGYAHFITERRLDPDLPAKRVLIQAAIGDASVTTLGARIFGRATGAGLITPAARPVWGLQPLTLPTDEGSAMVEVDYGQPEPLEAIPSDEGGDPHGSPLRSEVLQDQAAVFLTTGAIVQTCDGTCDPD